jgi:hypothetical protein
VPGGFGRHQKWSNFFLNLYLTDGFLETQASDDPIDRLPLAEAISFVEAMPLGSKFDAALRKLVRRLAKDDPALAIAWLQRKGNDPEYSTAVRRLARELTALGGYDEASSYLPTESSANFYHEFQMGVLCGLASENPTKLLQLLSDPKLGLSIVGTKAADSIVSALGNAGHFEIAKKLIEMPTKNGKLDFQTCGSLSAPWGQIDPEGCGNWLKSLPNTKQFSGSSRFHVGLLTKIRPHG